MEFTSNDLSDRGFRRPETLVKRQRLWRACKLENRTFSFHVTVKYIFQVRNRFYKFFFSKVDTDDSSTTRSKFFRSKKKTHTVGRQRGPESGCRTEKRPRRSRALQKLEVNRVNAESIYVETSRKINN